MGSPVLRALLHNAAGNDDCFAGEGGDELRERCLLKSRPLEQWLSTSCSCSWFFPHDGCLLAVMRAPHFSLRTLKSFYSSAACEIICIYSTLHTKIFFLPLGNEQLENKKIKMTNKWCEEVTVTGNQRNADWNNEMLFSSDKIAKNKIDNASKPFPIASRISVQYFLKAI